MESFQFHHKRAWELELTSLSLPCHCSPLALCAPLSTSIPLYAAQVAQDPSHPDQSLGSCRSLVISSYQVTGGLVAAPPLRILSERREVAASGGWFEAQRWQVVPNAETGAWIVKGENDPFRHQVVIQVTGSTGDYNLVSAISVYGSLPNGSLLNGVKVPWNISSCEK